MILKTWMLIYTLFKLIKYQTSPLFNNNSKEYYLEILENYLITNSKSYPPTNIKNRI